MNSKIIVKCMISTEVNWLGKFQTRIRLTVENYEYSTNRFPKLLYSMSIRLKPKNATHFSSTKFYLNSFKLIDSFKNLIQNILNLYCL